MSRHSDWIEKYLAATRNVVPERITAGEYSGIEAAFAKARFGQPPKLVVTYSYSGTTEVVSSKDETYLVYDQFARECFEALNWLLATHASPAIVQELLDFIIGQKLTHARASRPALKYLAHAMLERQQFPWVEALSPNAQSSLGPRVLNIQETFAIYHEYAHYILQQDPGIRNAVIQIAAHCVEEAISAMVAHSSDLYYEEDPAQWLTSLFSIPIEEVQPEDTERLHSPDFIAAMREVKQATAPEVMRSVFLEQLRDYDSLLEELSADHVSIFMTLTDLDLQGERPRKNIDWKGLFVSVFLSLNHIAELQLINHQASRLLRAAWQIETKTVPDLAFASALRLQAIHYIMRDLFYCFEGIIRSNQGAAWYEVPWNDVEVCLQDADELYSAVIRKHLLFNLTQQISDMIEWMTRLRRNSTK